MAHTRVNIDLAFPMPLSATVKTRLKALQDEIKAAKVYARKINVGKANEEVTIKGTYHVCHHDTGGACEPEQEI